MANYIVSSGEVSRGIILNNYDAMTVLDGGTATITTVNSGCRMYVSSGFAENTIINNGGSLFISSGGLAYDTTIKSYGRMYVSSGGKASTTALNGYCSMHVLPDGIVESTILMNEGSLYVDGGIATNTIVNARGCLRVDSFGTATKIIENGGCVILKNAIDANVSFEPNSFSGSLSGGVTLHSGTTANSVSIEYGNIHVYNGGKAFYTKVNSEGSIAVSSGGIANHTSVNTGSMFVSSNGVVSNTSIYAGGKLIVSSGGLANNIRVYAGGIVSVLSGAKIAGKLDFVPGAIILLGQGGHIDFDLTQLSGDNKALLKDWSLIQGTPDYTITVKGNQETGIYKLADAAAEFDDTITVNITTGEFLGTLKVGESFKVEEDTYTLRIDDESLVLSIAKTIPPDTIPPTVSNVQASITTLTNQDVIVTAQFDDNEELSSAQYRIGENGKWMLYTNGAILSENGIVYFKAIDAAGNESEIVSYTVGNIDKVAPSDPTGLDTVVSGQKVALLWGVSTDDSSGIKEYVVKYTLNGQEFTVTTDIPYYVLNNADFGDYSWSVQAVDFAGNESAATAGEAFTVSGFKPYTVECSADNFEHVITFAVTTPSLDAFRMPGGTYQLRVRQEGSSEWLTGDPIVAEDAGDAPQLVNSDADGNADVFFANADGTWESAYRAQHVGSIGDWNGTNEYAALYGKNKLADIIEGSTDANILLMTDDENGDALFVDDIYTASHGDLAEKQSRIAQIDEIRAGAGDDIVDMTSQRFEYVGNGLTIRGGNGNDTIWANKGDNWLFGDAGNDRIVGASGNDVIAGGIGNDRLHGGDGNDLFIFGENWGADAVEQLAGGFVTLWFASEQKGVWDESTLTYTDGENSVTVSGVTADRITLKFGAGENPDDADEFAALSTIGAFLDFTSERIFEESHIV